MIKSPLPVQVQCCCYCVQLHLVQKEEITPSWKCSTRVYSGFTVFLVVDFVAHCRIIWLWGDWFRPEIGQIEGALGSVYKMTHNRHIRTQTSTLDCKAIFQTGFLSHVIHLWEGHGLNHNFSRLFSTSEKYIYIYVTIVPLMTAQQLRFKIVSFKSL